MAAGCQEIPHVKNLLTACWDAWYDIAHTHANRSIEAEKHERVANFCVPVNLAICPQVWTGRIVRLNLSMQDIPRKFEDSQIYDLHNQKSVHTGNRVAIFRQTVSASRSSPAPGPFTGHGDGDTEDLLNNVALRHAEVIPLVVSPLCKVRTT